MLNTNNDQDEFIDFINSYNECWYNKDIKKLKEFYDDALIYFDNHKHNDTYTVEQHITLLTDFFKHGKKTESGAVEPLVIENLNVFRRGEAACLCWMCQGCVKDVSRDVSRGRGR